MNIDYTTIFNEVGNLVAVVAPLALTLGLCQWLLRFVLSAILGGNNNWRL